MRRIPISALIGLFFTALFFLSAIFADFTTPNCFEFPTTVFSFETSNF